MHLKPQTSIILKFSAIFLVFLVIEWWLLFLSSFNIPEFIPYTQININGLLLAGFTLLILILSQKEILKTHPSISVGKLTFMGIVLTFVPGIFFQFIRSITLTADKFQYFFSGLTVTLITDCVFSFFVAFQIKTKKTKLLFLFIFVALGLLMAWDYFFHVDG